MMRREQQVMALQRALQRIRESHIAFKISSAVALATRTNFIP
jgi:hypothetical protein